MGKFYPPVLDQKAYAIPYTQNPANTDYYDIIFIMPSMNNGTELVNKGHVQVIIKTQSNNEPAVNTTLSPDKATLFIQGDAGEYVQNLGEGNWQIRVPYRCFRDGKPGLGTTYTVQVRFGDTQLWGGAGTGIDSPNFNNFSAWRQDQVTSVPSTFGEWSNVQTVYCFGGATVGLTYNLDDFVPEIIFTYSPTLDDPIAQAKVVYYYSTLNGQVIKDLVFNGQYAGDNNYVLQTKLPIAPIEVISVSVEVITTNNSIWDAILDIPSLSVNPVYGDENGTMIDTILEGEEVNDGILAKDLSLSAPPASGITGYNVYRVNLWTLETLKIAEGLILTYGAGLSTTVKDYTVETGEDYQYVVCGAKSGKCTTTLVDIFDFGFTNPGYARLLKMDTSFLTTRKHQLRLQGNPSLNQFKRTTQDQFQPTIGSQYPFYQRNANTNYRSFNFSTLITINFDPTATFMRLETDNGLWWDDSNGSSLEVFDRDLFGTQQFSLSRRRTMEDNDPNHERIENLGSEDRNNLFGPKSIYSNYLDKNTTLLYGTDKNDNLVFVERKFREFVMKWLADGKAKLFRSETEGSMIVAASNVSFEPFDKSGRMVYTMSATFTEIAEYNLDNLFAYDLIPTEIISNYSADSDYEFHEGDEDPNVFVSLIYQYNKIYNIPNSLIGKAISPINTLPAVLNGTPSYKFSSTGLPTGLSINIDTGVISGTPTVASNGGSAVLKVTDASGQTANMNITIGYVYTALVFNPILDTIPTIVTNQAITPIGISPYVSQGVPPYHYMATNLPTGLTIGYTTGVVSGAFAFPVSSGSADIQAVDSIGQTKTQPLYYGEGVYPLTFTTSTAFNLPYMEVGVPITNIDVSPNASGGFPPYTFTAEDLPQGLTITVAGIIVGTPSLAGAAGNSTITVTDSGTPKSTASISISYQKVLDSFVFVDSNAYNIPTGTVSPASITPPYTLAPIDLMAAPAVMGGLIFNSGPPYRFTSIGLVPNFQVSNAGVITGYAQVAKEETTGTIIVSDARGEERSISINVAQITTVLSFPNSDNYKLPDVAVGNPTGISYGFSIVLSTIKGGIPDYRFTASGLPPGVTINSTTGVVSGTPNTIFPKGTAMITVTDSQSPPNQAMITIPVGEVFPLLNWSATPTLTIPDYPVSTTIVSVPLSGIGGGKPPYNFSSANNELVPYVFSQTSNVTSPNSVTIRGVSPSAPRAAMTVLLRVTDSLGQVATKPIEVGDIYASIVLTVMNSMNTIDLIRDISAIDNSFGAGGGSAIQILQATNGTPPYTYSLTNGETDIIPGVRLNSSGSIQGVPSEAAQPKDIAALFQVTDSLGRVGKPIGQTWYTPHVYDPLSRWDDNVANPVIEAGYLYVNQPYLGEEYIIDHGFPDVVYEASNLPPNMILDVSHRIYGTPTAPSGQIDTSIQATTGANTYTVETSLTVTVRFTEILATLSYIAVPGTLSIPSLSITKVMTPIEVGNGRSGGLAPYVWSAIGLPSGLIVSGHDSGNPLATVQGTPNTIVGAGSGVITVTDSSSPAQSKSITIPFSGVFPVLNFNDSSSFDIPAKASNVDITTINVAANASGGSGSYIFTADSNLAPYIISSQGIISGNSGMYGQNQRNSVITCTDTNGVSASITISIGAITGGLKFSKNPADHDIPSGARNTAITARNMATGTAGGVTPYTYSLVGQPSWVFSNPTTGVVTGTRPSTTASGGSFTLKIVDNAGTIANGTINFGATT